MSDPRSSRLMPVLAVLLAFVIQRPGRAESPTSAGPVSILDTPIFRIPLTKSPPTIDGVMAEGEWEDASALSGFWYDYNAADFRYMAPPQTQLQVYGAFDKEQLYIAYRTPVYPEASWLKARGRFTDVISHPLYGLIWDDHIELELRPYHDVTKGYTLGLFKWFVNPIGTYSDQVWTVGAGEGAAWKSNARIRCGVDDKNWIIEMAIPFQVMKTGAYAGKDELGQDILVLPPPDGTAFRSWHARAIGGNGPFFNAYDKHCWNTTKNKIILDSRCVSFQVNDIGPIMEDVLDVQVTAKNHNTRSETLRLGFFVENAAGLIYSSYEDKDVQDGVIELVPGEVRKLRLRKKFPGISQQGNELWFDVRSAGAPAKAIYQTRLITFHSIDLPGFRERRIDVVATLRPPKVDFDFTYSYSPYTNHLSAIVDKAIHGASADAKRAQEAKLVLMEAAEGEKVVAEKTVPFRGAWATFLLDELPELKQGQYKVSLLLFDENKRIVGERNPEPFYKGQFEWEKNKLGLDDVVWAPFEPIKVAGGGFETLKHAYAVAPSGLPEQIRIKPDQRDLPLEARSGKTELPDPALVAIGRGPQLRAPMRLEAQVQGKRLAAEVVQPARLVRQWKSELQYESKLRAGPLDIDLSSQYDCDGAMTVRMTYGAAQPAEVESFEMIMDVAGPVGIRVGEQGSGTFGGMAPSGGFGLTLPGGEGVVWDSAKNLGQGELYCGRFVPFFFFGSGDRAFTWICDSDRGWTIDRDGSTMSLERDKAGLVTWRVKFVNHKALIAGKRSIEFVLFVHPTKPKPKDSRKFAWFFGSYWDGEATNNALPNMGPGGIDCSDEGLALFRKRYPNRPPRLYINNWVNVGMPCLQKNAYTGEWLGGHQRVDSTPMNTTGKYGQPWTRPGKDSPRIEFGASWADLYTYHLERQIRLGRIEGWWWDETFPPFRTYCLASGNAYLRDPKEVKDDELPYQSNYASLHARNLFKRLARIFAANNVANRTYLWANNSSTLFESYVWDNMLIEGAASYVNSFDIDNITAYPISLFRYHSHPFSGLITRITSNVGSVVHPGDDKRLCRGIIGRGLLHDIGVTFDGVVHTAEAVDALNILDEFGYFDEDDTEMIPYWRSSGIVRYGEEFSEDDQFKLTEGDPYEEVYVTVYRRPYKSAGGRNGYKALFVVQNESDKPVRSRLHVLQPQLVFGGPNNLGLGEVRGPYKTPAIPDGEMFSHASGDQFKGLSLRFGWTGGETPVLKDMEDNDVVARARAGEKLIGSEIYGPVHIPPHNYRILYGHYDPAR